jgi:hypothetical protein
VVDVEAGCGDLLAHFRHVRNRRSRRQDSWAGGFSLLLNPATLQPCNELRVVGAGNVRASFVCSDTRDTNGEAMSLARNDGTNKSKKLTMRSIIKFSGGFV